MLLPGCEGGIKVFNTENLDDGLSYETMKALKNPECESLDCCVPSFLGSTIEGSNEICKGKFDEKKSFIELLDMS